MLEYMTNFGAHTLKVISAISQMAVLGLFGLCLVILFHSGESICPNGWTRFDSSCYLIVDDRMDWSSAEKNCSSRNAHLVTIENKFENDFIKQKLTQLHSKCTGPRLEYWAAGNDIGSEGTWVWGLNGEPFDFTDWGYNEPNSLGNQDCLALDTDHTFQWDDGYCSDNFPFICEHEPGDDIAIG